MKHFYWTLLLLLCGLGASAQQHYSIKGKVHKESGEPVSHVTIKIEGTDLQAISDEKGRYIFENVPVGKYNLLVSSVEIKPKKLNINVNKNYPDLHIHIDLSGNLALDEVRIQRNTAKRDMEISGFAVAVIETKEASLRNLTTNELLDRTVGVRVRQNGGVGSQVEYNLNGMSGSTIGLFLDGIELSTYGQSFNLNNIPPAMIERIEVYKGVLPSHLTGDYVGGAINVVLKKDASRNNATVAVSYGSFNTFNSDASVTLRDKKTGLSFRGSGFYTYTDNNYTTWGNSTTYVNEWGQITRPYRATRFNDSYESVGGRFEVGFTDTKWADLFFLGYNVSRNHNEIPHGTTMATPYVGRFNKTNANVFSLNYSKRDLFTQGLSLNVNAVKSYRGTYLQDTVGYVYNWDNTVRTRPTYVVDYDENGNPRFVRDANGDIVYRDPAQTIPDTVYKQVHVPMETLQGGQQGAKVMTQVDRNITNTRANLAYMLIPGHRVSVNHKYESTDRDDTDLLNPINKGLVTKSIISKHIVSMNYEAQTFNNKLRTNIMGKYTSNKTDQTKPQIVSLNGVNSIVVFDTTTFRSNFGYGATVSYNFLRDMFLISSMENSYVMPNEIQFYGDPETNILPNLNLIPEKNINYNLGFRWGMVDFGKNKISVYGNMFWRNGHDKITQEVVDEADIEEQADADIQTTRYVNLGRTQALGYEAEVIYIYNNRLNASVNFSKFENLFKAMTSDGQETPYYDFQIPNEPFFTINANLQYRFDNVIQKKSVLNTYYNFGFVDQYYVVWGNPEWSMTPKQFVHDIGASYRFPSGKMVASLDVKNLLNAEVYDNFAIQKPGRGVYFKLNYTIGRF